MYESQAELRKNMRFDVLIVEPDIAIAEKLARIIEKHEATSHCQFVSTGLAAMEYLKKEVAFLVITDFVLPDMDAFGLMDFISQHCAEVPVVVLANEVKPRTREILKKKGVADFLLKPLDQNVFFKVFNRLYKKVQSGGALSGISLDAFAQMVEMEQKNCVLRVFHMRTGRCGALFFQDGELVHARIVGAEDGVMAAEKILSWQPISMIIENDPQILRQTIQADLQALLMEAMRLRDEGHDESHTTLESGSSAASPRNSSALPQVFQEFLKVLPFGAFSVHDKAPDYNRDAVFQNADRMGKLVGAGDLVACYFCSSDGVQSLVSPQNKDASIIIPPSCNREKLLRILEYQAMQKGS